MTAAVFLPAPVPMRTISSASASAIARKQIENGASVIDINMDDAMLDSAAEMATFIRIINNDPDIAKAALMIDSSDWNTLLAGLKNAQGKCIVNSISLKEGEDEFLRKAEEIRRLGAAVVVMAFDEQGQAVNYERKISICKRAYRLLTEKAGFPPRDIIFDVNVLAIGTGMEEHNNYAVDFIRAVEWIKTHLPGCRTSGGVSNLSFSFRGNNTVREAMHSVFLYHAIGAGLDMAIVNPAMLQVYDDIEPTLLHAVEEVVLNKHPQATEQLIELAEKIKHISTGTQSVKNETWRTRPLEERLAHALIKGITEYLPEDIGEALHAYVTPVEIIEGPLMKGMERVGNLFGEGKMFLPQVVKSAKVMKEAVSLLQPEIEKHNLQGGGSSRRPKIVMATAKGDVHDIGKNIVHIVLSCNNFDVIDLGVMVDNHDIAEATLRHEADVIGSVRLLKRQEEAFARVDATYDELVFVKGRYIANQAKIVVDQALLEASPDGIEIGNCAILKVKEDAAAELILERLWVGNCAHVFCSPQQKSSMQLVCGNVAKISDGEQEEEEDEGGIMGKLKKMMDSRVVNADTYIL